MLAFVKKKPTWILIGIMLLYLVLRLPSLTYQPIFADEAIYIRWAQIAKAEPGLRFISLQDGKTPLYMWLMAPFLILSEDPLFAGRFLSVICGLFTLWGVFAIGKRYFSLKTGLIGSFLVAVTPFMIFFDRMALVDSMLASFTIWIIYWGLKLAHNPSYKSALILGVLLGGGWLTKTPGLVNIALLPLFLLFFEFKKNHLWERLLQYGSFFTLSAFIAGVLYLFQKIDPNFHQLSARNSDYIHPWSRLLIYPFDPLGVHFLDTVRFSLPFFGPIIIVLLLSVWVVVSHKNKVMWLLLLWSMLPFIYELEFIKAYTARYILYSIPPLLVLSGYVLDRLLLKWKGVIAIILLILISSWSLYFVSQLFTNLANLPLANAERRGYLEDWTAGYGLKEIANYLIDQSQNKQSSSSSQTIVVGTEGSFGTLPDGMVIYLDKYFHQSPIQKIIVLGDGPQVTDIVRNYSHDRPTFFIANKSRYPFPQPDLQLIKEYQKIAGQDLPQDSILFYRVYPLTGEPK